MRVGFLHMPWLPEQVAETPGAPSMALASIIAALRAAIIAARDTAADLRVADGAVS
jgi:pyroglutamyl-peptidase